jgi:PAS domain S-box-containing protein
MSDAIATRPGPRRRIPRSIRFVLAFVLIIANGIFVVVLMAEHRATDARVARALQAMLVLNDIDDRAEASGRDHLIYRLNGDKAYLDGYIQEQKGLPAALLRLRGQIANDSDLGRRLERLTTLIDQDAAAAASVAPVQLGIGAAITPSELAASLRRTNTTDAAVDDLRTNEQKLLGAKLIAADSLNGVILFVVSMLGSIALIGGTFLLMRRDARQIEHLADAHSRALQESELRFRRVFEESPLGMLLARPDGQLIVQANPAFCRMLGYDDADEMVGMSISDATHVDDRELLIDAVGRATDPSHVIEARCLTRCGDVAWVRVRLTQLSTSGEHQALLLALAENITHEKQVEAELRQAQKMEAIGQLTGGIAHDFNNLLGVIIGNVEFLLDSLRDRPGEADLAGEILNSALSGADLTRRLLAFARRQTLQPKRIDLNAYLPDHVAILRRVLGEAIQITPNFAANLWPIRADPSQVGDALLNLAINARDAMPRGGRITIETANAHVDRGTVDDDGGMVPGDYIVLVVADTGVGMASEVLERVVEPFFTTKEPGAGSGLGLSMIYGFARQSGGHLRIESRLGHGTTVRLYLPRVLGEQADDRDIADDPSLPRGHESILLVDDNAQLRAVGRAYLMSLGYRVTEAESGPAALAILRGQDHYDLLFTDVAMPHGMTGHQLAASARQLLPDLKVLFTTGYIEPGARTESSRPSPGATICKPYRRGELAISMRAALEA